MQTAERTVARAARYSATGNEVDSGSAGRAGGFGDVGEGGDVGDVGDIGDIGMVSPEPAALPFGAESRRSEADRRSASAT
jgi:hypothetical protein